MTPDFALSLSFEGIRLLRRVGEGWQIVGEVAPDAEDLATELSDLRAKAGEGPVVAKLIIPADQIKFMTIDTAQTSDDDVRAALEGTTPYAVDQLEIDFDRTGGRTFIAAVAKETLEEAAGFAREHGFDVAAFVAEPEPFTFRNEIVFGDADGYERAMAGVAVLPAPDIEADTVEPVEEQKSSEDNQEVEEVEAPASEAATELAVEESGSEDIESDVAVDAPEEEEVDDVPLFGTRRTIEPTPPSAAPAVGPATVAVESSAPKPEVVAAPATVVEPSKPKTAPKAKRRKEKASEAAAMTIHGARAKGRVGGKPRFLGLMLTAGLLIFLFLVALWANTLSEDGIAGWFRTPDIIETPAPQPVETVVAPEVEDPETPLEATETVETSTDIAPELREETTVEVAPQDVAAPLPAPESPAGTLPVLREAVGRVLSPAEADRIYAATGVYQRAPRMPLLPRGGNLEGFIEAKSIFDEGRLDQIAIPDREVMAPDANIATPRNPPQPGVTFARDLRGFILATPEGTVTPDGTIVFSGAPEKVPPFRPGTEIPDVVVERPLTGGNAPLVLVAGQPPKVPPLRPDGIAPLPEVAAAAAPEDTNVLIDNDELVVLAGAPLNPPPLRPSALADLQTTLEPEEPVVVELESAETAETAETGTPGVIVNPTNAVTLAGVNLANFRPSIRPAALAPVPTPEPAVLTNLIDSADPTLAGFRPSVRPTTLEGPPIDLLAIADPALAGFRPFLRPSSVAPAATPEATEEGINSVLAAIADAAPASPFVSVTRQAVLVSKRPDTRPRNFERAVARAVAASARAPAAPAAVASAPAVASGPVPGGVARAATIDNAIRLREINLIGVYGRPSDRRALIRLANGRYVRVEVGDSLDGGRVTAIGDTALNYVKRGRTYALQVPG